MYIEFAKKQTQDLNVVELEKEKYKSQYFSHNII